MMSALDFKIQTSVKDHKISALSMIPENAENVIIFAHGAGAGMHHGFMESVSKNLYSHGIGTIRFNFLYMETGRKSPDRAPVSIQIYRDVIAFAQKNYSQRIFVGGKSYGGRMASMIMSEDAPSDIHGLVFWGYPLHAPGKPSVDRGDHLKDIKQPMLFLQGTRDKLAELELIQSVTKPLPKAELHLIKGADHGFHVLKRSGRTDEEVIDQMGIEVSEFLKNN